MRKYFIFTLLCLVVLTLGVGNLWAAINPPQANYSGFVISSEVMANGDVQLTIVNGTLDSLQYIDGTLVFANNATESVIGNPVNLKLIDVTIPAAICDDSQSSITFDAGASIDIINTSDSFSYLSASFNDFTLYNLNGTWSLFPSGAVLDPSNPATLNLMVDDPTQTDATHPSLFVDELESSLAAARLAGMTMVLEPYTGSTLCGGGLFNALGVLSGALAIPDFEARTIGYWKNHDAERALYRDDAVALSTVFSSTDILEEDLERKGKKGMLLKARQQLAALLLNCAKNGACDFIVLLPGELEILQYIDPLADASSTVGDAIVAIESVINDTGATNNMLEHAKDLADEINNRDHQE